MCTLESQWSQSDKLVMEEEDEEDDKISVERVGVRIRHLTSKTADEMRNITNNFDDLLKTACGEIRRISSEKDKLWNDYETLLSVNEELANELSSMLNQQKDDKSKFEETTKSLSLVMTANSELFDETQRLSDNEGHLKGQIESLSNEISEITSQLRDFRSKSQEEAVSCTSEINSLKEELKDAYLEKDRLRGENEGLMSRKELLSGENLQLMVEYDEQNKILSSLQSQLRGALDKNKVLEKENKELKVKRKSLNSDTSMLERLTERVSDLTSQNRSLIEWRNQCNDKNKDLLSENEKLRQKCANLEDLLNEESADINEVLELIKNLQIQATNHNCTLSSAAIGPIAKFRDYKLHPR